MTLRRTPMNRRIRNTGPDAKTRNAVYERDGSRCALCGTSSGPFDVHHRKARSRGGDNRLSNLLLLCTFGGCHDLVAESQRTRSRLNGWLVDTAFEPQDVPLIWHGQLVWLCDDGSVRHVGEEAS